MADVLTNLGEEFFVDQLVAGAALYGGWGTGAGTAAKTDTTLSTAATEARVAATLSKSGTGSAAKFRSVFTITADGTKTITNYGLFDAAGTGSPPSGGNLVIHGDHSGVALNASDSIQYTVDVDPA